MAAAVPLQRRVLGRARRAAERLPGPDPALHGQRGRDHGLLGGERLHGRAPRPEVGRAARVPGGALLRRVAAVRQRERDAREPRVPHDRAGARGRRRAARVAQGDARGRGRLPGRRVRRLVRRHAHDVFARALPARRRRRARRVRADRVLRRRRLGGARRRRVHVERHRHARLRRRRRALRRRDPRGRRGARRLPRPGRARRALPRVLRRGPRAEPVGAVRVRGAAPERAPSVGDEAEALPRFPPPPSPLLAGTRSSRRRSSTTRTRSARCPRGP